MIRALIIVIALAATAHAEPDRYSVGADLLSSTMFRGVGLEGGVRAGHWGGRLAYAYQQIPSMFVDMDSRDKGWSVTANVFAAAVDYWFGTTREGAYLTFEPALKRERLGAPMGGSTTITEGSVVPGIGYRWSPFHNALYVEPRFMLIVNTPVLSGTTTVGSATYHSPPVIPGGWIVVGAAF